MFSGHRLYRGVSVYRQGIGSARQLKETYTDKSDKRICTTKEHERKKVVGEKGLEKRPEGDIDLDRAENGRHLGRKSIHRLKRSM